MVRLVRTARAAVLVYDLAHPLEEQRVGFGHLVRVVSREKSPQAEEAPFGGKLTFCCGTFSP
ncbi:hypothetical protein ACLOJK_032084 [Asimina triloba]